jgi:hypothetical protein
VGCCERGEGREAEEGVEGLKGSDDGREDDERARSLAELLPILKPPNFDQTSSWEELKKKVRLSI